MVNFARVLVDRVIGIDGQPGQGTDIVGIGFERLFADTGPRDRVILYVRLALESQVLGVGTCRCRPFASGRLGLRELKLHRMRQMSYDLILRLQQIGARGVELLGPEMASLSASMSWALTLTWLVPWQHRAFQHICARPNLLPITLASTGLPL